MIKRLAFYLCARKTNEDAHRVYQKAGFDFNDQHLTQFGYNPHYFIGMSHKTTVEQISEINRQFTEEPQEAEKSYFCPR